MRRAMAALLLALLVPLIALGGCGIPEDSEPAAIANDDLPESLNQQNEAPEPGELGNISVYYFTPETTEGTSCLEEFTTDQDRGAAQSDAAQAELWLDTLLDAPSPPPDLTTATAGLELVGVTENEDVLIIEMGDQFEELTGTQQTRAVAQLVFTATQPVPSPRTQEVEFRIEGQEKPLSVPTGVNTNSQRVKRSDYNAFAEDCTSP